MTGSDSHEFLWKVYERVNSWIGVADTKAGLVLALQGVILAASLSDISAVVCAIKNADMLQHIFLIIIFLTFSYSVWQSLRGVMPRISPEKGDSVIYFGHIAGVSHGVFQQRIISAMANAQEIENQMISQIHINSSICLKKHKSLRRSGWSLVVSVCMAMMMIGWMI